jgi:hypothetical protein
LKIIASLASYSKALLAFENLLKQQLLRGEAVITCAQSSLSIHFLKFVVFTFSSNYTSQHLHLSVAPTPSPTQTPHSSACSPPPLSQYPQGSFISFLNSGFSYLARNTTYLTPKFQQILLRRRVNEKINEETCVTWDYEGMYGGVRKMYFPFSMF